MDRAFAARAFQPFYTTKHDGMGVGLSISHAIVEAHGGIPWADPGFGTGSTLHFTLPATADDTSCGSSPPPS